MTFIQSVLAGLGFLVAGLPGAGLWAVMFLIAAVLQVGVLVGYSEISNNVGPGELFFSLFERTSPFPPKSGLPGSFLARASTTTARS